MINNGVPNDLISNFNSLTIVVCAPILNFGIYPLLARYNIRFPPMWKMSFGFALGGISMIIGAIEQWKVYEVSGCSRSFLRSLPQRELTSLPPLLSFYSQTSPCGYSATDGIVGMNCLSSVNLWAQM